MAGLLSRFRRSQDTPDKGPAVSTPVRDVEPSPVDEDTLAVTLAAPQITDKNAEEVLTAALQQHAHVASLVAAFEQAISVGEYPAHGQGEAVATWTRMRIRIDALEPHLELLTDKSQKTYKRLIADVPEVQDALMALLNEAPGDAVQVMPLPFPSAFASSIPTIGWIPAGDRVRELNVAMNLLGVKATATKAAIATTRSADGTVELGAAGTAVETLGVLSTDLDVESTRKSDKKDEESASTLWKTLDLPEPLPARRQTGSRR